MSDALADVLAAMLDTGVFGKRALLTLPLLSCGVRVIIRCVSKQLGEVVSVSAWHVLDWSVDG